MTKSSAPRTPGGIAEAPPEGREVLREAPTGGGETEKSGNHGNHWNHGNGGNGGAFCASSSSLSFANCTLSANHAGSGGSCRNCAPYTRAGAGGVRWGRLLSRLLYLKG